MNINQQEKEALVVQKVTGGKTHEEAYADVERDRDFLRNHDKNMRELKKQEKQKIKDIESLDKKFKKEFSKLTEPKKESTKSRQNFATTYHLKRILNYLEDKNDYATNRELCEACCTSSNYIKSGLIFLERYGLVESIRNGKGVQVCKRKK